MVNLNSFITLCSMNTGLAELLSSVLGEYELKSKGNLAFTCPFCKHYKKKLEIHNERQQWNCWVCGSKGRSIYTLFKKLELSEVYFIRLNEFSPKKYFKSDQNIEPAVSINLPKEYIPLWIPKPKNFYYRSAIKYLAGRYITINDILKYRLGYCEGGTYDGMIIIPNYNKQGKLTYFTNRSFLQGNNKKFINPPMNRNVIGFELQLNWDEPLTIVESGLDAIVIRNNATPLYGKIISEQLKLAILENEVKHINICLDPDAVKEAFKHSEYFISNGININFVKLPEGDDPSTLGYDLTWKLINSSKQLSSSDLFTQKIMSKL